MPPKYTDEIENSSSILNVIKLTTWQKPPWSKARSEGFYFRMFDEEPLLIIKLS